MHPDMSWVGVLEHHADRTPDKPIAVFGDDVVTYREHGGVGRRGWPPASHERGVGPGDVVGLLSYNSIEFLTTIFAANHLGAIAMPINWRLAAEEVRFILDHSRRPRPRVRRRAASIWPTTRPARLGRRRPRAGVRRPTSTVDGWERFADLGAGDRARRARAASAGDDIHRLMYTSGTTGRPKGVMISHANLAWKNYAHITEFGFTSADVGLACGPLYHVGALDLVTTSMIAVGRDDDHPPGVRRRGGRRRDRAVAGDVHVDRAGDGARDPRRRRASTTATSRRSG